jgi:Flp pilus assembly protein TadG
MSGDLEHVEHSRAPRSQRGAALILVVVGMVAILGIVGLALDTGHAMLNKTRLQNSVDAAALAAAKVLDQTADEVLAEAAANAMFATNAGNAGNREIGDAYASGEIDVAVQFSSTLNPFTPGTTPASYVRVRAQGFTMPVWFSRVVGVTNKGAAASAVAGPSPTINQACNLMPMMVCGDPAAGGPLFGYTPNEPDVLKSSTTNGNWEVGPGNFQLIRLGGGQGGAVVREAMAGGFDGCMATGDMIETEPGNTVGPVVQGFNTRFGEYLGPLSGTQSTYPPDVVVQQPIPPLAYDSATDTITQSGAPITEGSDIDFNYDDYVARVEGEQFDHQPMPNGIGAFQRREVAVAIGDCNGTTNGQGQVPLLGFGCFFLLQAAQQQGNESHIYGEFLEDCRAGGMPGPEPSEIPGPYIIQLYRDYSSNDS